MNRLLSIDEDLLLLINSFHNTYLDNFMWLVSSKFTWIPLYVTLIIMLFYRYRDHYKLIFLLLVTIVLAIAGSDFVASQLIKETVCRYRPTHNAHIAPLIHIVNGYKGGIYGFVSNHAADTATLTTLYSLIWRNRTVSLILIAWTVLNCYSRLYLGVHYPLDILGGLVLGITLAASAYCLMQHIITHCVSRDDRNVWNCKCEANH